MKTETKILHIWSSSDPVPWHPHTEHLAHCALEGREKGWQTGRCAFDSRSQAQIGDSTSSSCATTWSSWINLNWQIQESLFVSVLASYWCAQSSQWMILILLSAFQFYPRILKASIISVGIQRSKTPAHVFRNSYITKILYFPFCHVGYAESFQVSESTFLGNCRMLHPSVFTQALQQGVSHSSATTQWGVSLMCAILVCVLHSWLSWCWLYSWKKKKKDAFTGLRGRILSTTFSTSPCNVMFFPTSSLRK